MENNQAQNTEIKIDTEAIKNEILEELKKAGAKVIPSIYDGKKEIIKLIEKFEKGKEEYKTKTEYIKSRYSVDVKNKKLKELEEEWNDKVYWLKYDLDNILKTDNEYRLKGAENRQVAPGYKEKKRDTLQLLALAGNKLDADILLEEVKGFIEAKDLHTLKIFNCLVPNNWVIYSAVRQVEEYFKNEYITDLYKATKSYIGGEFETRTLTLQSLLAVEYRY